MEYAKADAMPSQKRTHETKKPKKTEITKTKKRPQKRKEETQRKRIRDQSSTSSWLGTFMVAADHVHSVLVPHLESHQQRDGLEGIVTPIDVVPKKQKIRVGRKPCHTEKFQ